MKRILAFALAACAIATPAAAKKDVPVLSGAYVYTSVESCTSQGGTSVTHITGIATLDPDAGTATLNGFHADGQSSSLEAISQNATYSNTKTTLTLNGQVYQVFYGTLKKKVATYLSYIGTEEEDGGSICSQQAWLSRQ